MSITTTTGYGRQWEQRVMITITITLMTIIMNMPTLMTTAMTTAMTINRVSCTMAKGKRDCRSPAWGSAS